MMELLGKIPKKLAFGGKYSKDFFNRKGDLKAIRDLNYWGLEDVFIEKYKWSKEDAAALASFIQPMLRYIPEQRATAAEMLKHDWLNGVPPLLEGETEVVHTSVTSEEGTNSSQQ